MAADAKALVKGFTLVELMIVMAILSMVTVSATYAFSLFSRDWEVRRGGFERAKGQLRRRRGDRERGEPDDQRRGTC